MFRCTTEILRMKKPVEKTGFSNIIHIKCSCWKGKTDMQHTSDQTLQHNLKPWLAHMLGVVMAL